MQDLLQDLEQDLVQDKAPSAEYLVMIGLQWVLNDDECILSFVFLLSFTHTAV